MEKVITAAVAGCGSRGQDAYSTFMLDLKDRVKVVAAADLDPEKLAGMRKKWGLTEEQCYASAEEMLAQPKLADVMLICTPDNCHYGHAKAALLKDYHLLLEKPIAPRAEELKELADIATARKLNVVVCHVLRYTPFYQKVKEIMDSGELGEIVTLQGMEHVCYWHQAHSYVRGNWRDSSTSSCMILAKCCHDMDILLWLTGKRCKRVSSFGSLTLFREDRAPAGAPLRCTEPCPAADTCPYNAVRYYMNEMDEGNFGWPVNVVAFAPTREKVMEALQNGPYGRCVYHCDNNVVDHQVVTMELEGGATADYTMTAFTAHGGRDIRVMGTHGELVGDMKKNVIRVMPFGKEEREIDVNKLSDDFSGHGGGDKVMIEDFLDLVSGRATDMKTVTSIQRSVESHLVALAAEESRLQGGKPVEMGE